MRGAMLKRSVALIATSFLLFLLSIPSNAFATPPTPPPCDNILSEVEKSDYLAVLDNPQFTFLKEWEGVQTNVNGCIYKSSNTTKINVQLHTPKEFSKFSIVYQATFSLVLSLTDKRIISETDFADPDHIRKAIASFENDPRINEFAGRFPVVRADLLENGAYLASDDCLECEANISLDLKDGRNTNYQLPSGTDYRFFPELNQATEIFNNASLPYDCRVDKEKPYYISYPSYENQSLDGEEYLKARMLYHVSKCPFATWGVTIKKDGTYILDAYNYTETNPAWKNLTKKTASIFDNSAATVIALILLIVSILSLTTWGLYLKLKHERNINDNNVHQ